MMITDGKSQRHWGLEWIQIIRDVGYISNA